MGKVSDLKKVVTRYVAPISQVELSCRLVEAAGRLKRPEGFTTEQAFAAMDREDQEAWARAAVAALEYFRECIAASNSVS